MERCTYVADKGGDDKGIENYASNKDSLFDHDMSKFNKL
jgi:hypothetical protein